MTEEQKTPSAEIIQKSKDEIAAKAKKLQDLKVEWVPYNTLKPNWYNPNRQSDYEFELLCKSMEEDGFTQPIVALKKDGTIVDGEHRWRAAGVLGYTEVPVVFVDMSLEQMMVSTLRHNRARGSEDSDLVLKLMKELAELGAVDWVKDSLALNDDEMERLMKQMKWAGPGENLDEGFERRVVEDLASVPLEEEKPVVYVIKDERGREIPTAMSKGAADEVRRRKEELERTINTQDWKKQVELQKNWVLFSFAFSMDESVIVKKVLGKDPAGKILEMCKEEAEYMEEGDANVSQ